MGLKEFFKNPASGAIEGVGNVVDKFVQTPDERDKLKAELEKEISKRWDSDMKSDSWLSKNVRPLGFASVLIVFFIMLFTDGNIGGFQINKAYLPIYNTLLVTITGGYFVVRTVDKRNKVK